MSERIVLMGPIRKGKVQFREITPMDAGAYLNGGNWRVYLGLLNGELANATVITRAKLWEATDEDSTKKRAEDVAWETVEIMSPRSIPFEIEAPLTRAECRVS